MWWTSSLRRDFARLKNSSEGRGEGSVGLVNVSPSAPEIGQRSQTRPPRTADSEEYFDAGTGKGVTRLASPSASTTTGPPVPSSGSRPPVTGRPSTGSANGEGVAEFSGTRYGRQPSGKERSPVCTS